MNVFIALKGSHFWFYICLVDLPCFSVVRSLTSWYTLLLLFFLRHASTSWHWPVSKSLLPSSSRPWSSFKSLYSLWLLLARLSFSSGLIFGHSGVTQSFLFRRCLPRSSAAVSVTALLKWVTMESRSASSSTSIARGTNLPPIVAWKALLTVGSYSFSRQTWFLAGLVSLNA